jgi:S1-C subfamily serine protease
LANLDGPAAPARSSALEMAERSKTAVAKANASRAEVKHRNVNRRADPIRHSLVMLATVFAMLAAARFVLPGIVEELRYAQHRGQLRAEFEVAGEGLRNVSLDTLSQAYQMVNAAAGPSVVHIDIHRTAHEAINHSDFPGAPSILISDQGSGVVVDASGYVLTNRHVVATSDAISVTLSDGRVVDAAVIGTDEQTDLAVLKVDADNLIPIPWGDSERIRVGSPVWAIGSPFGLDRTVTFGILSGKHRVVRAKDRYQDFMQSDVAVNPGNSGGPLVDSRGTLIGINTAIVGDTYQGVSFAIPSSVAKKIYLRLRETGVIERGYLGVSLAEVPDDRLRGKNHRMRGALVMGLADGNSGAARAGLKAGDIIVQIGSERVRNRDHLMQVIGNAMAGAKLSLSIVRDDQEMELDVSLGRRPDPLALR